jgi:hypothetical protein
VTPPSPRTARRGFAVFASAIAAALILASTPRAVADESAPRARIAGVRIGFNGAYKLGCWTQLQVEIEGDDQDAIKRVEAIVADSDGVPVTTATMGTEPLSRIAGRPPTANLFVRVGQDGAPLTVRLVGEAGRELASRTFIPNDEARDSRIPVGLPATNKLVITLGAREDFVAPLARTDQSESSETANATRTILLETAGDMPVTWYGYEGVDTFVISGSQGDWFAHGPKYASRIAALTHWVELGGRLVIFCGVDSFKVYRADGFLLGLLPGEDSGSTPIPEFTPLENFSGAANQLPKSELRTFRVPRVVNPQGRLLAQGPGELPLVIRARRQFGEITFVAVDPEQRPLADWSDRPGLLRQALQWPAPAVEGAVKRAYAGPTTPDLTNQLRSALDQQFDGVDTASFALVALLAVGYIALVGPGDYFFVRRVLKRMELTWVTFPLLVVATSAAAYALAYRMKGDELRVNQVEIVDVDVQSGAVRGTVWTHVFNPEVARYTLTLAPRFAGENKAGDRRPEAGGAEQDKPTENADPTTPQPPVSSLQPAVLTAWLGVPGFGLGAMQGHRGEGSLFDRGYDLADDLATLEELPVEQWSTKSLTARWTGEVERTLEAVLRPVGDDQLEGHIENRLGVRLEDCVLMRGGWAYQLPTLEPGGSVAVDESLAPRTIRTTLTSAAAGDDPHVRTADDGTVLFAGLSTDVARLVKLMMFYESIGGSAYANVPNRYQGFIDLSRLLKGDQAILLARAPADAGSHWIEGPATQLGNKHPARPLASEHDRRWVYYRFVIPLEPSNDQPKPRPEPPKVYGPSPLP